MVMHQAILQRGSALLCEMAGCNVARMRVCNIFARTLSGTAVVDVTIEAPSLYSLLCETQNDRPLHFCYIDILALQKGNVRMRSLTY